MQIIIERGLMKLFIFVLSLINNYLVHNMQNLIFFILISLMINMVKMNQCDRNRIISQKIVLIANEIIKADLRDSKL